VGVDPKARFNTGLTHSEDLFLKTLFTQKNLIRISKFSCASWKVPKTSRRGNPTLAFPVNANVEFIH